LALPLFFFSLLLFDQALMQQLEKHGLGQLIREETKKKFNHVHLSLTFNSSFRFVLRSVDPCCFSFSSISLIFSRATEGSFFISATSLTWQNRSGQSHPSKEALDAFSDLLPLKFISLDLLLANFLPVCICRVHRFAVLPTSFAHVLGSNWSRARCCSVVYSCK
jgi:hypothetical protein